MAAQLPAKKPLLVAVDTNVLLDLAEDNEQVWGAVETIRRRLKGAQIVVLPTVIQELAHLLEFGDTPRERRLAGIAAQRLVKDWKFAPINFIPVGHGITERIAESLRERGLLPVEEVNDSFVVAESALASCAILLSSDRHVRDIPADQLSLLLAAAHVATIVISTPREIAKKFGW